MKTSIQTIILDWAGTTVDFGRRSSAKFFLDVFRQHGIEITLAEARGPMGRAMLEHIEMIVNLPRVAELWLNVHGSPPTKEDVMTMYSDSLPMQKQILAAGSDVIPDIPEAIQSLRKMGLQIGSSTGYTRELMDVLVPLAATQGYEPDGVVCGEEVTAGHPAPWLNLKNAERMNVQPGPSILVVDDTLVGIEAGRNAGMKTVAVSMTGNELGLSLEEVLKLAPEELHSRLQQIEQRFFDAGADYVISSVGELPRLVKTIK